MASPQGIDHYMPFFGRDFYASTAAWTAEEVGHYIRLLVIQWDNGSLAADIQRLELVSPGVSKVWGLLEPKFPLWRDGQHRNRRMNAKQMPQRDGSKRPSIRPGKNQCSISNSRSNSRFRSITSLGAISSAILFLAALGRVSTTTTTARETIDLRRFEKRRRLGV